MSLCPHGYTAFWDCPICPEPLGTAQLELHSQHTQPVLGCDRCDDLLQETRELANEWRTP